MFSWRLSWINFCKANSITWSVVASPVVFRASANNTSSMSTAMLVFMTTLYFDGWRLLLHWNLLQIGRNVKGIHTSPQEPDRSSYDNPPLFQKAAWNVWWASWAIAKWKVAESRNDRSPSILHSSRKFLGSSSSEPQHCPSKLDN